MIVWLTTNWKILKEMGIPDDLTCLLRSLYAGQEATVRTRHGQQTGSKLEKEYIIRNAGLEEAQAGIKIAGRNINNLRYVDDTTLMAESEEELKSLLIELKEESEKAGLKLSIQKHSHVICSHQFMANRWGNNENSDRLFSWAPKSL